MQPRNLRCRRNRKKNAPESIEGEDCGNAAVESVSIENRPTTDRRAPYAQSCVERPSFVSSVRAIER